MTTYRTHKLNDPECRSAKPKDKLYRLRDGGGLSLDVLKSGVKTWRYNYRIHGKQKTYTIGNYPDTSLSEARISRDKAKKLVSTGIDPSQKKQIKKRQITENSFQAIAETWLSQMQPQWADGHYNRVKSYLERDVFPIIGSSAIDSIEIENITLIIMSVANRGAIDASKRVKGFIQQVFDYAVSNGKCRYNPVRAIVTKHLALPETIKKHYSAVTSAEDIAKLLRDIDLYHGTIVVKSALQLAPLVMARPSEISNAEWSEINFDAATWTIPAKRRKLPTHLKKANLPEHVHIIPLCSQALAILKNLKQYTRNSMYLFPNAKTTTRPMSNNTLRTSLRSLGYDNDTMTAHGFRTMASTVLNDMKFRREAIETQLAHKFKSEIEESYNHSIYLDERRDMLNQWGDYLDSLKQGADVVPIRKGS